MEVTKIMGSILYGLLGGVCALLLFHSCSKDLPSVKPTPAETKRINILYGDSLKSDQYRIAAEKWQARCKALQSDLISAKAKDKSATEKARHSANTYVKTGTLASCDSALLDCQRENETKAYSIAIQDRMLGLCDSLHRLQNSEIARLDSVKGALSDGWAKSNEALRKALKPKRFGLGVMAGYGITTTGLSPCISFGISYNFKQF